MSTCDLMIYRPVGWTVPSSIIFAQRPQAINSGSWALKLLEGWPLAEVAGCSRGDAGFNEFTFPVTSIK
jgi:hypothetical protein